MPGIDEPFRTLFCDPGEDFGWCLGRGTTLLAAGTEKMHPFSLEIWDALFEPDISYLCQPDVAGLLRDEVFDFEMEQSENRIGRIVCEDFKIYPWAARQLSWNPVRTARVIGKIELMCEKADVELVMQPAAIKKAAQAAGAEELFYFPLHENRHQNDAILHYTWYISTQLLKIPLKMGNQYEGQPG